TQSSIDRRPDPRTPRRSHHTWTQIRSLARGGSKIPAEAEAGQRKGSCWQDSGNSWKWCWAREKRAEDSRKSAKQAGTQTSGPRYTSHPARSARRNHLLSLSTRIEPRQVRHGDPEPTEKRDLRGNGAV